MVTYLNFYSVYKKTILKLKILFKKISSHRVNIIITLLDIFSRILNSNVQLFIAIQHIYIC